tara:strand:- start:992 stop:1846 length:855 start_codon:yes stop_codon:yes gene_type:complete
MKKELDDFSLETLWFFLKDRFIIIIVTILAIYLPSSYFVYKNSNAFWIVEAKFNVKNAEINNFINNDSNYNSILKVNLALDNFFEEYSKFLAKELNKNEETKLMYQLGSEDVRVRLNNKFFNELFNDNKFWVNDYWKSRGITITKESFLSGFQDVYKIIILAAENSFSDFNLNYKLISSPSIVPHSAQTKITFQLPASDYSKDDIKKLINDINSNFQSSYNYLLFLQYGAKWEKQKNFDLVSIELKEIKKINEKLINIIKLLFVISLSVYVIFFIIFYRSAIRF